jgi:mRNA-degrading endonuclease YafQ of YafQ-DinJ toxin-antitoxin module
VPTWTIVETRDAQKVLGRAPLLVREKYEVWKRLVAFSGPRGLHAVSGFNDEALRGQWQGYRSSRLSGQYRVIYRAAAGTMMVHVERVSPHDYRR